MNKGKIARILALLTTLGILGAIGAGFAPWCWPLPGC